MAENAPTLRRWYEDSRRPDMAWRLSPATLRVFDKSITAFERFAGDDLRVDAINEPKLAAFIARRELGPRGRHTARYRRSMARCVRRIVRDFDPTLLAASRDPQMPPGDGQSHLTLRGYVDEVYLPAVLANSSDDHRSNTRSKICQFDEFHGGDVLLSELADAMLESFLASLWKNNRSVGTVNQYRAIICAVWRHAWRVGLSTAPPRVKRLPSPIPAEARGSLPNDERALAPTFPRLYSGN